uniref:Uncharacterized protein n=1 Tax=Arundo donax TaxID=35708 RepID=A0A0A9GGY4_ARUDO
MKFYCSCGLSCMALGSLAISCLVMFFIHLDYIVFVMNKYVWLILPKYMGWDDLCDTRMSLPIAR